MKKLLITSEQMEHPVSHQPVRYQVCALYEGQRMMEIEVRQSASEPVLNHIYIARVKNVAPNLNAAFVEIEGGGGLCGH